MKRILSLLAAALMTSAFTGCSPERDTVAADGSSSMERVIGCLGEAFTERNDGVTFTYNPTGSGTGIRAVLEGRCDIGLSSRDLREEEKAAGLRAAVLAYDGIAVIVNPENPVSDLDLETIGRIYTGEITNWSEAGGKDGEIVLIGREAGSGTRDCFESVTGTAGICRYRQELTSTGDVITAVSGNPWAIGYASAASVKGDVRAVDVGGVQASEENIRNGSYAVRQSFFMVTRTDVPLSDAAQRFYDYALSEEAGEIISFAGAVPAV